VIFLISELKIQCLGALSGPHGLGKTVEFCRLTMICTDAIISEYGMSTECFVGVANRMKTRISLFTRRKVCIKKVISHFY
jgi:hypothetical protein